MKITSLIRRRKQSRKATRILRVIWPALGAAAGYQFLKRIRKDPHSEILVAKKHQRAKRVMALAVLTSLTFFGKKYLYVRALGVHPKAQRQGLGEKLLQNIEESATKAGSEFIFLASSPHRSLAHRFYLRHGFRRIFGFLFWKHIQSSKDKSDKTKNITSKSSTDKF